MPAGRSKFFLSSATGAAGRMAADRVAAGRSRTHQVLALYSACQHQAARPGAPGQAALDHRTRLPGAETRARLGALRRPRLARVSPPKHLSRVAYGPHKGERGYDPTQHQQYWDTAWDSLTKAAGLEGIRFHDLRHTFITHMVERGVPLGTIQAFVGHMSSRMLKHYTHISSGAARRAVELLDAHPILVPVQIAPQKTYRA